MMLLSSAKSGAKGKDATNSVTNPNWMTAEKYVVRGRRGREGKGGNHQESINFFIITLFGSSTGGKSGSGNEEASGSIPGLPLAHC